MVTESTGTAIEVAGHAVGISAGHNCKVPQVRAESLGYTRCSDAGILVEIPLVGVVASRAVGNVRLTTCAVAVGTGFNVTRGVVASEAVRDIASEYAAA